MSEEAMAGAASALTVELGGFRWEPDTGMFASGHLCYAGKWPIGKVCLASRSKEDKEHLGAYMRLPGLKECLGYYMTEEEARARVESVARYWFSKLKTPNVEVTGLAPGKDNK